MFGHKAELTKLLCTASRADLWGTTGKTCRKSPPKTTNLPPNSVFESHKSRSRRSRDSTFSFLAIEASSQIIKKVDIFEDILAVLDPPSKIKKSHSVKLSACFRDLLTEALKAWPYASKLSVYSLSNSEFPEVKMKSVEKEEEEEEEEIEIRD